METGAWVMVASQVAAVALIAFALGRREATQLREATGEDPYGVSPWLWATLAAVALPVAAVSLALYRRAAKRDGLIGEPALPA